MRVLLTSLTKGLLRQPAGTGAQLLNTFRAQSSSASVVYRNTVSPRIPMLLGRPSATPLAQFTQRAGIRIKASDPNADKASSPRGNNNDQAASPNAPGEAEKEAERKERNSQQEAEDADSQGLDLFAQAAANQRRREAAAAAGPQGGGKAAGAESEVDEGHHHMDPKEAERIKKWKQQAEEEEKRQMQRSTRMFMFTLGMFSLSAFVYLGR
ncbi:uncharacterized protein EV422DRAFT_361396 [Fimicolochytrium jonesii]|uniref:uncharacterized protein n=1 Tax=Fimicolochytrium jonesii TaxID=1396493 RepID=UPI0022FEA1D4|nr:uncharacterized protein EV422DRAFT_361396 [Fimicolochytrium jonesii]KAI8823595.1 hypothetical protein EV422DRAFT_361396 [Fimicolochytrium jonesii]